LPAISIPFLIGGLTFGIISLVVFLTALVILSVPVLGTRGTQRLIWAGISTILLLVLAATLVTLTYLVGQERILQ
jgi:hypothetical protein